MSENLHPASVRLDSPITFHAVSSDITLQIAPDPEPPKAYCFGCRSRTNEQERLTPCPSPDIEPGMYWLCQRCSREGRDSKQEVALTQYCCICWTIEKVATVREDGEWLCPEHVLAKNAYPDDPVVDEVPLAGKQVKRVSQKPPVPEPDTHRRGTVRKMESSG